MKDTSSPAPLRPSQGPGWSGLLARVASGLLAYLVVTGLPVRLLGFSPVVEWTVLLHTLGGLVALAPVGVYLFRHWKDYRADVLTPAKVTGWIGLVAAVLAFATGIWVAALGLFGEYVPPLVRTLHLVPGLALLVFGVAHLWPLRGRVAKEPSTQPAFSAARRGWVAAAVLVPVAAALVGFPLSLAYDGPHSAGRFPADYRLPYGQDRPVAPSLARTESGGALSVAALSGSASCGRSGCHPTIYKEWSVSAHRYSAMDAAFQRVQEEMGKQNGPDSTRYCGGCHDPISLFAGMKTVFREKLTDDRGMDEGVSCLTCHAVVKTDVQGNANYVVRPPKRYLFETSGSRGLVALSDFLIRTYPVHHTETLSKRLFKTPEYCGACHKQFVDQQVNNFGWVQLQNQYDNWRKSKWNHPGDAKKTIECRECHMPLLTGVEPASGDTADYNRTATDGKHRSHRFLGANQYMPALLKLPGADEQVKLVQSWLSGTYQVPEIQDKWATGKVVSLALDAPEKVKRGEEVNLKAVITSNKVGHDYPTGPLDLIQSWIEVEVTDASGNVVFTSGHLDKKGLIPPGSFLFKVEPVDRYGNLIDRHHLWEMVGVRYRRSLFPGYSDQTSYTFACPGSSGKPAPVRDVTVPANGKGPLTVTAYLRYRKLDQFLVDFLFPGKGLSAPVTTISEAKATIEVAD